jgi:hypothetical protein
MGRKRKQGPPSFVEDTMAKTGRSRAAIYRDLQAYENLLPEVREAIWDTPLADNQSERLALSQLHPDDQVEALKLYMAGKIRSFKRPLSPVEACWRMIRARVGRMSVLEKWDLIARIHETLPPQEDDGDQSTE